VNQLIQGDLTAFPSGFEIHEIQTNGATIHTRVGGNGPAVILSHGFGTTGDMWIPLAAMLAADRTVIVPDLRGLGLSSKPKRGYDKKAQSRDVAGVMDALGVSQADFVTHDIGNMVAYAFASEYRDRVRHFVPIDAPLPGVGPWEQIVQDPQMWQFGFGGLDMERLVAGRERIYLDRFWNDFSLDPIRFI
jgi:pimeloyl-ACP methyl ester carboxylesterase